MLGQVAGFGEAALAAFRATNLLYPLETSRLQSVLRGADADNFVRAVARFASGDWKPALADMERLLRPLRCSVDRVEALEQLFAGF